MPMVTASNHGPLINVGMWIALAPTIIITGVKIYTKWETARRIQMDDLFMMLALLAATAQTVATTEGVRYGLGRNQDVLTDNQNNSVLLCEYVAQMFYVIAIYFSKLAGLYFFILLAASRARTTLIKSSIGFVFTWITVSFLTISFRCHPPRPWLDESSGCIDETAFWTVNLVIDIVTQCLVGLLPIFLLASLQAERSKKLFSMLSFTPNLLTVPLAMIRIVYIFQTPRNGNYTWSAFNLSLVTALHAVLSVFFAAIPFSKPIVDSMVLEPMSITDSSRGNIVTKERPSTVKSSQGSRLRNPPRSMLDSLTLWPRGRSGEVGHFADISVAEQEMQDYEGRDGSQERIIRQNGGLVIHQTTSTTVSSALGDQQEVKLDYGDGK